MQTHKENAEKFRRARLNDPLVAQGLRSGSSLETIIGLMAERHELLVDKLMQLEAIAPRRLRLGDSEFIYHAPDELVPLANP